MGFWRNNWKWLLPVVGLTCGAPCLLTGGALGLLGYEAVMKPGPYRDSLEKARADARVKASLGEPLEPRPAFDGRLRLDLGQDRSSLSIPLAGSRANGWLVVEAWFDGKTWRYPTRLVHVENGPIIDLEAGEAETPPGPRGSRGR